MTTSNNVQLAKLSISQVVLLLPPDCDWRIVDSRTASVRTFEGRNGRVYRDEQDPANVGWAYQLASTECLPEESGELNTSDDLDNVFN